MTENMREILADGSAMEKLNREPFVFLEGPVWDKKRQRLYFSDPLAQTIIVTDASGGFKIVKENTGYVNGMCLNGKGNLAVCKMDTGTLEEVCPDTGKTLRVIAEGYNGQPFNATNDVVCDKNGGYYITDPFFSYGPKTQDVEATYYRAQDGTVTRVAADSKKPNGLALSPDGKWLYIDDTGSGSVWRYEVLPDGSLTGAEVFCTLEPPENAADLPEVQRFGEADGLKVDSCGNIYVTTFTGVQVFRPDGKSLGTIRMQGEETAANCEFGGKDMKTLYITARTSLYKIGLSVPGI